MKLRKEQMEAFSEAAVQDFEDRMAHHLQKCFPEQCEALGNTKTREAIREGIALASDYGITLEPDVCRYISLMFAFGRRFDRDRQLPWAGRILNDPSPMDASAKVDRLYEAATAYARGVAGVEEPNEVQP